MNRMKHFTKVFGVLSLALLAAFAVPAAGQGKAPVAGAQSEWVYSGKDGKLHYKTSAMGDRIMDFSHAGYMGGGVALPGVPIKRTIKPSGKADDTELIQSAVNEVSLLPVVNGFRGAVLLEPGNYPCQGTIQISADGVVLKGSGTGNEGSVIVMTGEKHTAVVIGQRRSPAENSGRQTGFSPAETPIRDSYIPSGSVSFNVTSSKDFAAGDVVEIRKPVTGEWIRFMEMDNLVRDGKPQTWIREGNTLNARRTIAGISGNLITLDVPLSDSYDAKFTNAGTRMVKVQPGGMVSQSGVEDLHIKAPAMETSWEEMPYSALRIYGEDCWARNLLIEETMNSVATGGRRITLEKVVVTRSVPNVGSSKPAEFAPNATQVLMNRCSSHGDNIWHAGTGAGIAGPIVLLNCTFSGNGHIEGHQRWTTGILVDNCQVPDGGIDFKNRGSMGSGHGWGSGWSVAWNCTAKSFVVQQPPGTCNWMIGCTGPNIPTPRPFDKSPDLPLGISDSPDVKVTPASLYLSQLEERLGRHALRNIGY